MRASAYPETGLAGGPVLDMQAARLSEARSATQDGYIWPVTRAEMITGPNIRERMAEDLGSLVRERGAEAVITTEDYLRLGWTRDQVALHGGRAGDLYESKRHSAAVASDCAQRSVA